MPVRVTLCRAQAPYASGQDDLAVRHVTKHPDGGLHSHPPNGVEGKATNLPPWPYGRRDQVVIEQPNNRCHRVCMR